MAVIIRLKRFGKRSSPTYRIIAIEEDKKRQGREIEVLGYYNPCSDPPKVEFKRERVEYWQNCGARISKTVGHLLDKRLWKNS